MAKRVDAMQELRVHLFYKHARQYEGARPSILFSTVSLSYDTKTTSGKAGGIISWTVVLLNSPFHLTTIYFSDIINMSDSSVKTDFFIYKQSFKLFLYKKLKLNKPLTI